MESIKNVNEIVKSSRINPTPELPEDTIKINEEYFKNYKSYSTYYKAKTTTYNIKGYVKKYDAIMTYKYIVLTSYQTEIAILNTLTGDLYLNADYYNCSKTTTEQLEHFKTTYKEDIVNQYYLNYDNWNQLYKELQNHNTRNINNTIPEQIKADAGLKQPIFNIMFNTELSQHQKALKILDQINYLEEMQYNLNGLNKHITRQQTTELKTRIRHNITLNINGVELELEYSSRKRNYNQIISKFKIRLVPDQIYFKYDLRNTNDKKLYGGYDMGVSNNKALTYKGGW